MSVSARHPLTHCLIPALISAHFADGLEPSYQLYADVQVAIQSFCEFKQAGGLYSIPQDDGPPQLINRDPLKCRLFDRSSARTISSVCATLFNSVPSFPRCFCYRGGYLDTAARFHMLYMSLPEHPSLEDVLQTVGRRVTSALERCLVGEL